MATTAACRAASIGSTSGSGLARAKTTDRSAMVAMSSPVSRFGADTPMNTSAPASASTSEPVTLSSLVCSASQASSPVRPSRPRCTTPPMSATTTCAAPAASSSLMIAVPAAPAPDMTIRTSAIFFSTTRSAL